MLSSASMSDIFAICMGQAYRLPLQNNVHIERLSKYDLSIFVLDAPGNKGMHSDVLQLSGSMGCSTPPWFSPSRPSTEVSSCCEVSWPCTGCCPVLTVQLPLWHFSRLRVVSLM